MSIQNVNGRNVYVLSPKAPTGKTTSGKSWATLYSDLRWQVWEAQQKNEENKIKLDLMSFEAKKEYYDQQKKFLQNRMADLQDIKLKTGVSGDGTSKAIDQTLRAYDLSAPKSLGGRGASGPTYRKTIVTGRVDRFGDPIPGEQVTETYSGQPVEIPASIKPGTGAQAGTVVGPPKGLVDTTARLEARANRLLDEEEKRRESGEVLGTGDIDAEIKKLEDQLSVLTAPQFQTDTDLLNRTQRAFEQNVGVIGQGGGPFGLAPRSRRLAPRVDQPRATAAAQELIDRGTAEAEARRQLEEARKALLLRREDLMAAAEVDSEDAVAVIDEQLADVNAQLSQPTAAQKFMADESFIPRKAGEFLLRGPTGGRDEQPVMTVESGTEVIPSDAVPSPSPVKRQLPQFVLPSPDAAGFQLDTSRRAELEALGITPQAPPATPEAPPAEQDRPGVTVPEVITPMQPSASVSPEQGRENAASELYTSYAPRKINADTGEDTLQPLNKLEKQQIFDKWLQEEDTTSTLDEAGGKAWYNNAVKEIKAGQSGKAAPPTSKQRKELYSFNVSSEGILLAQKPKQLARLAKTSLPDDKRPQHIVIVDKLFETNANKANAFRLTYDEVSRVFANDPKKRTEAHKYLVAKDVLEGNKREPLA